MIDYFNHHMALQMCGGGSPQREIIFGGVDAQLLPDVADLEATLQRRASQGKPVKMVVFTSPNNPSGMILPRDRLEAIASLCLNHGAWLVMDNTYEEFVHGEFRHACIEGENVVNIFSFSKAYGMMGWRIGYLAYPSALAPQLLKVQDTIPICPTQISQHAALGALVAGSEWVQTKVQGLAVNLAAMTQALAPLGEGNVIGGQGAIYLLGRLPERFCQSDEAVVKWLAYSHGVCLIPGSACGAPGFVRVCFANIEGDKYREALARLHRGLGELAAGGGPVV